MITISLYRLFFACATNIRHSAMYFFCFSVYNQKAGAETTPLQYCHMKKQHSYTEIYPAFYLALRIIPIGVH